MNIELWIMNWNVVDCGSGNHSSVNCQSAPPHCIDSPRQVSHIPQNYPDMDYLPSSCSFSCPEVHDKVIISTRLQIAPRTHTSPWFCRLDRLWSVEMKSVLNFCTDTKILKYPNLESTISFDDDDNLTARGEGMVRFRWNSSETLFQHRWIDLCGRISI